VIALSWEGIAVLSTAFLGIAILCITATLAKLSSDEVSGWIPVWSIRLLDSAVAIIPPEHRDRYREEWLAELAAFHGRRVSGLRFAWRLRRRARSMHDALRESKALDEVFESEAPPVEVRALDPEAVAAIVRRAVDKTKPRSQRGSDELLDVLIKSLAGLEIGDLPAQITRHYVDDLLDWRERGRDARHLTTLHLFDFASSLCSRSPVDIERDAARRQRSSERRRRSNPRRRFPFSFWL
jgi:hypothetical protein